MNMSSLASELDAGILEIVRPALPETSAVDKIMGKFVSQWESTADACEQRAKELEDAAIDLRHRASELRKSSAIADDVRMAVAYEIDARNRAAALVLVNPSGG